MLRQEYTFEDLGCLALIQVFESVFLIIKANKMEKNIDHEIGEKIMSDVEKLNNDFDYPLDEEYLLKVRKLMLEKEKIAEPIKFSPVLTHAELILKQFQPIRYTIEPFFEQGTMNMVSAPPNTWKSWLLFLFAGHIANGTPIFDKFATDKTGVMIVNEEDSARLIQDRLKLLKIIDPLLLIYYRIAQGSKLTNDFVDILITEAKERNIGVIMFDSLRAIHEAEENSSTEMQGVLDLLKKIARENITVIFTHHHRKKSMFGKNDDAESSRGTSAINAAISGHISLEEVERDEGKYLIVKHLKSKVGEKLPPFDIEIKTGEGVNFHYLGEHQPKEQALTEAKAGILLELQKRDELLGRKDFVYFKIGGETTIKEVTKILVKENKIKAITRAEAKRLGQKIFNPTGKGNEILYSLIKDEDFGVYNSPPGEECLFDSQQSKGP